MSAVRIRSPTPKFMIKVEDKSKTQEELQGVAHLMMQKIFKSNKSSTEQITPSNVLLSDENEIKEINAIFEKAWNLKLLLSKNTTGL